MLVQVVLSLLACWSGAHAMYILEEAPQLFEDFIHKYEKTYATEAEKQHRFNVFVQNLDDANRRNKLVQRRVFGINKFSDLTSEEFKERYTCFHSHSDKRCRFANTESLMHGDAPDSWDWRTQNVVTNVKNQGQCGSCFDFSAVGNVEGQYAIKHKQLYSLSEQQVLDCGDFDCSGGYMPTVYKYIKKVGGIELESDYPYVARKHNCKFDKSKVKVQVTDCLNFDLKSQEELKQLLYKRGPISIGIDASDLSRYVPGHVIVNCTGTHLSHAVLLVGYGTDDYGIPYWLVKNSWGTGWGDEGYFKVERGEGKSSCGMMNKDMSTAIVA